MAKYKITHACGHTTEQQLYGKHDARYKKIAWWETVDCPACWRKAKQATEERRAKKKEQLKTELSEQGIIVGAQLRNNILNKTVSISDIDYTDDRHTITIITINDDLTTQLAYLPLSGLQSAIKDNKVSIIKEDI